MVHASDASCVTHHNLCTSLSPPTPINHTDTHDLDPYIQDWSLHYSCSEAQTPRHVENSLDLYIPGERGTSAGVCDCIDCHYCLLAVMGFVTYILLTGLVYGTQQRSADEFQCNKEIRITFGTYGKIYAG